MYAEDDLAQAVPSPAAEHIERLLALDAGDLINADHLAPTARCDDLENLCADPLLYRQLP